jgi:hypothetical protein
MGTYVYFYLGSKDGIQSPFLSNIGPYHDWLTQYADEFPADYPSDMVQKIGELRQMGATALVVATEQEATLIDRITDQ